MTDPDFFRKREMLDSGRTPKESLGRQGEEFLAQGRFDEALAFFGAAEDDEGRRRVLEASRSAADVFSFEAALRATGVTSSKEEWDDVGERALAKGFLWFAYRAFEKSENQGGLDRVRAAMTGEGISHPE